MKERIMLGDADAAVTIAVKNQEAAKKFYGEVLGLTQEKESEGGVTFKSGNTHVFVYPSQYAGSNKATYASWTVDDIEATIADLKGKGVSFMQYPDMPDVTMQGDVHVTGPFKIAWFSDPDGNILALDNGEE